jgi:hypothetical protein
MKLGEIDCEDMNWMKLAQDRVQLQAVELAALNLRTAVPECYLVGYLKHNRFKNKDPEIPRNL